MSTPQPFVSVVVPVRNEAPSLPELLTHLRHAHDAGAEIVVVDDASTDDTAKILTDADWVTVVRRDTSAGFGAAVKSGLAAATGRYVAWLPGNLRVVPLYAVAMAWELDRRATYGTAFAKAMRTNRPWTDRTTTFAASVVVSIVAGQWLPQSGGTPTVVPASALPLLASAPDDLGLELYVLRVLPRRGLRGFRPGTPFGERRHGTSTWNSGIVAKLTLLGKQVRTVRAMR